MDDLFQMLEKWTAKHRTVSLQGGPWVQPGDGWHITLFDMRTRRRVHINECDPLFDDPDGAVGQYATAAGLAKEALRRWAVLEENGGLEWPEEPEPPESP